MVRLHVLGPAELRDEQGALKHSFLAGPKRLALLVYLVLHRPHGFQRRDALLPLFWPERGQNNARNALSNMLYHMRRVLGRDVVVNRGVEEIGVNREVLWCDALAFEEALATGRPHDAYELYRGELLKGFHLPDASSALNQWLDRERERLRRCYQDVLETLAEEAEEHGKREEAVDWWRKRADEDPFDSRVTRRLMNALAATGNRTAALRKAQAHAQLLEEEFGAEPHEEIQKLTEDLPETTQAFPEATPTQSADEPNVRSAETPSTDSNARTIAVLPFETLGAAQTTSFTDGIHGDLLTRLSSISDVQVISRTSVRQYRHTNRAVHQIAQELGAKWVLEGEVQEAGGQIQVNARLVNARADRQVWARDYRRDLTAENLFRIQGEITKEITRSLKATLTPEERKQVGQRPTGNLEAYRLCAQGRRHLGMRTEEGIRRAIGSFEQAAEQDPEYVLAWAGLADALILLHEYGYEEAERALPRAEQAARRALDLDPTSAEAHASLGLLHEARRQGPQAVRELQRAVELKPSYAEAHNWLSWVHQLLGHPNEALESAKRAVELDPLSPEAVSNLSVSYLENGAFKQALAEARRDRELGSSWGSGRFYEGLALYELERFEEAKSVLQDLSTPWADVGPRATLALVHAAAGDHEEARAMLAQFEATGHAFAAGLIHAALRNKEAAFDAFRRVERWGDYWPTLAVRHYYRNVWNRLRADVRYETLLRAVDQSWGLVERTPARDSGPLQQFRSSDLDPHAIAVLPFSNLSENENVSPFAAGLHNDLLTKLSRMGALTVISHSSVLQYRDPGIPISEIAHDLKVGTIVEGRVQRAADRVRLNVQLTDARDESLRWAETYDRGLTAENLFDIQSELAEKIAGSLQATLTPEEKKRVGQQPTNDLEAYRLYAQGRRHLDARTEEGIRQAFDDFQRAIEQDARYALAWAGLADAFSLLEFYGFSLLDDLPDPMEAPRRAVELDPELGEAHASLGIRHVIRQEGPAALHELGRAVELTPSYAEAHVWLGWVQLCLGRPEEGLTPAKRAVELNPLAPAFRVYLAEIQLACGETDDALRQARRAREIQPEYGLTHFMEGLVLYHQGRLVAAASALQQALSWVPPRGTPTHAEVRAALAVTHAVSGDAPRARELLDEIDEAEAPFSAGLVHAALGDADAAFDAFDRVSRWGTFETEHVRYFFPDVLGPLRDDARYDALIRRVNQAWGLAPDGSLPEDARYS